MKRTFHSSPRHTTTCRQSALLVSSVALIAGTYGMARFGVGLLYPQMVAARPGLVGALPPAGMAQFLSYCVAVFVGGQLARTAARAAAAAAGLCAGIGCLGLLVAQTPSTFIIVALIAGAGAGLASPALVPLLDQTIPAGRAGAAQTAVNSGTAIGLMISGALVLLTTGITLPWLLFALVCVAAGLAVAFLGPRRPASVVARAPVTAGLGRLALPAVLAMAVGGASAYVWTYGPSVIVQAGLIPTRQIGWLWLVVGMGGLLGVFSSRLVDLIGPLKAFLISTVGIGLATAGVALASQLWFALASLAIFGACYMILSGVLILWGRVLRPANGGQATAWLFLALAVGQAMGAAACNL